MSDCHFTFPFNEKAEILIARAKKAILNNDGATFEGNESAGNFSLATPLGQVKGSYSITSNVATFDITEKPFFVNCNLIESKLKGFITSENM